MDGMGCVFASCLLTCRLSKHLSARVYSAYCTSIARVASIHDAGYILWESSNPSQRQEQHNCAGYRDNGMIPAGTATTAGNSASA